VLGAAINEDPVHGVAERIYLAEYREKLGVFKHNNMHSGYIIGRTFLDLLSDY
jgi:hypothetical protein